MARVARQGQPSDARQKSIVIVSAAGGIRAIHRRGGYPESVVVGHLHENDREGLEALARYCLRPPVAQGRLSMAENDSGKVVLKLLLEPGAADAANLATFDDGAPALVEARQGAGGALHLHGGSRLERLAHPHEPPPGDPAARGLARRSAR
jgi:hypothetical protein